MIFSCGLFNGIWKELKISKECSLSSKQNSPSTHSFMWHQEPDGLLFLRPIMQTVTHSGVDLKLRNLQVWNKTGNKDCVGKLTTPTLQKAKKIRWNGAIPI